MPLTRQQGRLLVTLSPVLDGQTDGRTEKQMLLGRLITLLCLLSGALPTGSGRPEPQALRPQSWAAANQTWALGPGAPPPLVPAPALRSWKAFLGLQKARQLGMGRLQHGQDEVAAVTLPLNPQEVTQGMCKAVPFVQVFSRPGCSATRLRNHLCFGHCSSLYIPGSDPTPLVLCNSCMPARKHSAPVVLWCHTGSSASRRRVKITTVLIEGCHCSLKA
ncbi:DAN domain family member 5 [Macaca nemestrina]|uniref:DAN domain family member 5 n=1 Tax=Macaca nemestrina TaxID=9545 RepID=UPI0039B95727